MSLHAPDAPLSPPVTPPSAPSGLRTAEGRPRSAEVWAAGGEFVDAELQSLVAAGALHHLLGRVYAPAVRPVDAAMRAEALWLVAAPHLATGWTAMGLTAAWLHAGGPTPRRLHLAVAHYHRPVPTGDHGPAWTLTQSDVAGVGNGPAPAEEDVTAVGRVRVTTVARTVEDLLLADGAREGRTAARLLAAARDPALAEEVERRMAPPRRRPGIVRARRRLRTLLS